MRTVSSAEENHRVQRNKVLGSNPGVAAIWAISSNWESTTFALWGLRVRASHGPLIIRLGEAFEFTVLSWPYRLAVRTSAFHAENPSSILGRVIRLMQTWRLLRKFLGTYTEKNQRHSYSQSLYVRVVKRLDSRLLICQRGVFLPCGFESHPGRYGLFVQRLGRPTVYRQIGVRFPYGPLGCMEPKSSIVRLTNRK